MGFAAPPNIDCALFRWHIVPLEARYSDLPRSLLVLPPPEKGGEGRVTPSERAGRGGRRQILAIHPRKAGDAGLVSPAVDDAYLA